MAKVFDRMREGPWMVLSFMVMALVGSLYALSRSVPVGIALLLSRAFALRPRPSGGGWPCSTIPPSDMRGRVNSAFFVVRDIFYLLGWWRRAWLM